MRELSQQFWGDERGATAIEYGLIAGLIAMVVIVGMGAAFHAIGNTFNTVDTTVSTTSS